jgi:hypothetical protein
VSSGWFLCPFRALTFVENGVSTQGADWDLRKRFSTGYMQTSALWTGAYCCDTVFKTEILVWLYTVWTRKYLLYHRQFWHCKICTTSDLGDEPRRMLEFFNVSANIVVDTFRVVAKIFSSPPFPIHMVAKKRISSPLFLITWPLENFFISSFPQLCAHLRLNSSPLFCSANQILHISLAYSL